MFKITFLKKKLLKNFREKIQRGPPCWKLKIKKVPPESLRSRSRSFWKGTTLDATQVAEAFYRYRKYTRFF